MRFQRVHILAIVLLLAISALVFTKTSPSKPPPDDRVSIINKTSNFQVLQATRNGNELTVSLKNNYGQRITAFALTAGEGFRITEDFITSEVSDDVGIQPQEMFQRTYPLPADKIAADITLQAVVMDDKTGDGDPVIFEDIRDTRLGQAVQIRRSLKLLEKYLANDGEVKDLKPEMVATLDQPETETLNSIRDIRPVGTINRKSSEVLSDYVKEGLAAARADLLRKLDEAQASHYRKDSLHKMKVYYQKVLNRL